MSISSIAGEKRVFTLQEARDLVPLVRKITVDTVGQVNDLLNQLEYLTEEDTEFEELRGSIDATVRGWAEKLQKLGCEVKGLWLVDFDNGQGYYCWSFPEDDDELDHFHGYEEDVAERKRIC